LGRTQSNLLMEWVVEVTNLPLCMKGTDPFCM
jgi:hypothetical protein